MQCGIYQIRNLVTEDRYIGSTIHFKQRWSTHRCDLRNKVHHNQHLVSAWHKHGESNFAFEVLEECSPDNLLVREQVHLDAARALSGIQVYNLSPIADHRGGGLSDEGRRRKQEAMRGNAHTFGRKRPPEECAAISAGNRGKVRSPEAIENYRRAAQKREAENRRLSQAIPVSKPWETQ